MNRGQIRRLSFIGPRTTGHDDDRVEAVREGSDDRPVVHTRRVETAPE